VKLFRIIGITTSLILIAVFVMAISFATSAEEKKKTANDEKANIDGKIWNIDGKKGSRTYDVTGDVIVHYQDVVMTADKAIYTEKDKTVIATGNVKIVDPENEITGQKGIAYLNQRLCVIEGNVKLITKPKQQSKAKKEISQLDELKSEPVVMTCGKIEYLYRKKIVTADGDVKVVQKDKTFTTNKAVYDVNQELLTLPNGVDAIDEEGQTFTSKGLVKVFLKEGSEWIQAEKGSARIKVNLDEEGEDTSNSSERQKVSEKSSEKN
jgi:lipopolysaccharide assembly outer membrane protein LptD (OstA)